MGILFKRYFELLSGRCPDADFGVIATPSDPCAFPALEAGICQQVWLC